MRREVKREGGLRSGRRRDALEPACVDAPEK